MKISYIMACHQYLWLELNVKWPYQYSSILHFDWREAARTHSQSYRRPIPRSMSADIVMTMWRKHPAGTAHCEMAGGWSWRCGVARINRSQHQWLALWLNVNVGNTTIETAQKTAGWLLTLAYLSVISMSAASQYLNKWYKPAMTIHHASAVALKTF